MARMTGEDEPGLRRIVREEVTAAFSSVGLFPETPDERAELRADFAHLRRWRSAVDGAALKLGYFVLLSIAGGVVGAVVLGVRVQMGRWP